MTESMLQEASVDLLAMLKISSAQKDALAAKFAKLPKIQKQAVRSLHPENTFENEVEMYSAYILAKMANDYILAQNRDIWIQRLEMLIPRLTTKDERLKKATDNAVAGIALEIEDQDERANVLAILKKGMYPKTTNAYELSDCFDRASELFNSAWKS